MLEDFRTLWRSIARSGRPPAGLIGSRAVPPEALIEAQGGRLLTVGWDPPAILDEVLLPTPSGFADHKGATWVGSAWTDRVLKLVQGQVVDSWSHPWLNDAHHLESDGEELLVTSAGSDSVLSPEGWTWHGRDRGETHDVLGEPLGPWRRGRVPTLRRALHLNSALRRGPTVLATSMHRGAVLALEERARVVLQGLASPHGLRADGEGFLVCEAGAGRVLELDEALRVKERRGACRWMQDAERAPDGRLFALDVPDLRRPDPLPSRIVEVGGEALELPEGWRPHTLRVLHA